MKTAFVFSGQGAQYEGMGKELYERFPECGRLFDEACEAVGFSLHGDLSRTEICQPAILTLSMAAYTLARGLGITPDYMAGLSLGEYSALTAAGVFNFADAVRLVHKRGTFMAEACPPGAGAMSAVLSLSREEVIRVCEEASDCGFVMPANFNMAGQIVIGGEPDAVKKAGELAVAGGAKKVLPLAVAGAFHTPMMNDAAAKLSKYLDGVATGSFEMPVLTNVTGDLIPSVSDVKPLLIKQIVSPVEWERIMQKLIALDVTHVVELGPGRTLSAMFSKTDRNLKVFNIEDSKSYDKLKELLDVFK